MLGFPDLVEVGHEVAPTVGFVDDSASQTHTASATWTDACPAPAPTVSEMHGVGQVQLHVDAATGVELVDYDNRAAAMTKAALALDGTVVTEGGLRLRN
jgi:hypothetical protein